MPNVRVLCPLITLNVRTTRTYSYEFYFHTGTNCFNNMRFWLYNTRYFCCAYIPPYIINNSVYLNLSQSKVIIRTRYIHRGFPAQAKEKKNILYSQWIFFYLKLFLRFVQKVPAAEHHFFIVTQTFHIRRAQKKMFSTNQDILISVISLSHACARL